MNFRMLTGFVAIAMLAACAPDNVDEVEAVPAEAAPAVTAVDGGTPWGTFEATGADGVVVLQEVREDGTLTNTMGDEIVSGSWEYDTDGAFCARMEGDDGASCYVQGEVGADGSWSATNRENSDEVWMIRRIETANE